MGFGSFAEASVVETLDAEGDDTRQDDVLFLDVHLFLGLLRILLVPQDVAQFGAEDLDGGSLALGEDGESKLVNLAGWRIFGQTGRLFRSFFVSHDGVVCAEPVSIECKSFFGSVASDR